MDESTSGCSCNVALFEHIYWSWQERKLTIVNGPEGVLRRNKLSLTRFIFIIIIIIVVIISNRLFRVFEVFSGLLVVAQLLVTLPLQVPLQDLLHQEQIGPFGPQEHAVRRRRPPQCWGRNNTAAEFKVRR